MNSNEQCKSREDCLVGLRRAALCCVVLCCVALRCVLLPNRPVLLLSARSIGLLAPNWRARSTRFSGAAALDAPRPPPSAQQPAR